MINSGCKTAQVDEKMNALSNKELPENLVASWEAMVREDIKHRFEADPDRVNGKHPILDKLL